MNTAILTARRQFVVLCTPENEVGTKVFLELKVDSQSELGPNYSPNSGSISDPIAPRKFSES